MKGEIVNPIVIAVYGPTFNAGEKVKDLFYDGRFYWVYSTIDNRV